MIPMLIKEKNGFYRKGVLTIEGKIIHTIDFCDRFARPLTKINYVRKLSQMVSTHYKKECQKKFLRSVRKLYTIVLEFPRNVSVTFNGDRVRFEKIRRKYNKRYRERSVTLSLTPEEVTDILSK
jgi:hypothetical protein